ncbi:MAG TPA: hypothetical protein VGI92_13140 [Gemmatimonadales bacterium]|jgi:hypothetical protein
MKHFRIVLGMAVGALLACESTTGPGTSQLPLGDTVVVSIAGGDSMIYHLAIPAHQAYAVYAKALSGAAQIYFQERNNQLPGFAATLFANTQQGQPLLAGNLFLLAYAFAADFDVHVTPVPANSSTQLQLFLYRVDSLPEGRAAAFAIGDTVSGSIDPGTDVDVFTVSGTAGQQVTAVLQQQATAPGVPQLSVTDPSGTMRGVAITSGINTTGSTGVIAGTGLPVTGVYTFTVSQVSGQSGYRGAYRFWTTLGP